jgi:DNA invertase Pin-like site-specific DNA recombinase
MRVALYARVSTQRQAQSQTIDQQLRRLEAHVRAQGWEVDIAPLWQTRSRSTAFAKLVSGRYATAACGAAQWAAS